MLNVLLVIAAPGYPLAGLKRVRFAQLSQETFLSREPGSGTRSAMERIFAEHEIRPRISMEMETRRLAILNVEHFPLLRHWYVAHRSNKRLSGAVLAFKEFLLAEAKGITTAR